MSLKHLAAFALVVAATPALASDPLGLGAALGSQSSALSDRTDRADTVAEGLSLDVSATPLSAGNGAMVADVDGVLFLPLAPDAAGLWQVQIDTAPGTRVALSAVQLIEGSGGLIEKIESLDRAEASGLNGPFSFALPAAASHLEIATAGPVRVALAPVLAPDPAQPPAPEMVMGETRLIQLAPDLRQKLDYDVPAGQNLSLTADLPLNFSAVAEMRVGDTVQQFPLTGTPATAPIVASDRMVADIRLIVTRARAFANDPWPTAPITLGLAEIQVDEREPNQRLAEATPIPWPEDKRRVTVTGQSFGNNPDDLWALTHPATRADRALSVTVELDRGKGQLRLLDAAGTQLTAASGEGEVELSALMLDPGTYYLEVRGQRDVLSNYRLKLKTARRPRDGKEVEPNDTLNRAMPLELGARMRGHAPDLDLDHIAVTIPQAGRLWGMTMQGRGKLTLLDAEGQEVAFGVFSPANTLTRIEPLPLPIGTYVARVENAPDYALRLDDLGPVPLDWEQEPNNAPHQANVLPLGETRRGLLSGADSDLLTFRVPEDRNIRITLRTPDDTQLDATLMYGGHPAFGSVRLTPSSTVVQEFALEAGEYGLSLSRIARDISQDPWSVTVEAIDPSGLTDLEPNGLRPVEVTPGMRVVGDQMGMDPEDSYVFPLPDSPGRAVYECARLDSGEGWSTLAPVGQRMDDLKATGKVADADHAHDGTPGRALYIQHRHFLEAGYDCAAHWLTDETLSQAAAALPAHSIPFLSGYGPGGARDIALPARIQFPFTSDIRAHVVSLSGLSGEVSVSCDKPGEGGAGLRIHAPDGPRLANGDPVRQPVTWTATTATAFALVEARAPLICTFAAVGQTVADAPKALTLAPALRDYALPGPVRLTGTLPPPELMRPPVLHWDLPRMGEMATVACTYDTPGGPVPGGERPEFQIDRKTRLDLRPPKGASSFACTITPHALLPTLPLPGTPGVPSGPATTAALVPDREDWAVPTAFAGGFNVASAMLGGVVSMEGDRPSDARSQAQNILDGTAHTGEPPRFADGQDNVTIDLAGDTPLPLVGAFITFRPQGAHLAAPMRQVVLEGSRDGGQSFAPLGRYALTLTPDRQYLPFPPGTEASHIRLINPDCRDRFCLQLSELGIVAQPGTRPDTLAAQPDLAEPRHGGHVVTANTRVPKDAQHVLVSDDALAMEQDEKALARGEPLQILMGFHRARAPRLARIEWSMPDGKAEGPAAIRVFGLTDILSPGVELGSLPRPAPGARAVLDLPEAPHARFLRLEIDSDAPRVILPGALRVYEQAAAEGYHSILGTWDEDNHRSALEWGTLPAVLDLPEKLQSTGDAPVPLPRDMALASVTQKEDTPDWFVMPRDPEATQPQVWRALTLSAPRLVEVGPRLYDADGTELALLTGLDFLEERPDLEDLIAAMTPTLPDGWGDHVTYFFQTDPGQDLRLRVAEEGRLMIIRRERTGLISQTDKVRKRSFAELAQILGDGQDAMDVGVPALDGGTVLKGEDDILLAMARLQTPDQDEGVGTTDFGDAIANSASTLRGWPGGKALVYFGMGGGIMQAEDMDWVFSVTDVPVRTTSILVPCNDGAFFCPDPVAASQNPITFAASTGGTFKRTATRGEIRDALLAAAAEMTGPKPYAVSWTDIDIPPPPAFLQVDLAETGTGDADTVAEGAPSVALILDASGSMLKRMGGQRRIQIAREALVDLVTTTIPEDTDVSFRAFGLARDACESRALVPLAPLDRDRLTGTIREVPAINLAKTAIAASLRAAATEDLAQATGPRALILLTDGEETCDGNVQKVLEELEEAGIQVNLSIVGFAIDDDDLKSDFARWAEAGNGAYFDAGDGAALKEALREALAATAPPPVPQTVTIEREGSEPQTLPLGERVALSEGRYRLTLDTGDVLERDIGPGEALTLTTEDFTSGGQ